MNQQFPHVTVGALIFNSQGQIFLMKSHKWRDHYVIPGGHIELGETIKDTIKREVKNDEAQSYIWTIPQQALMLPVEPYTKRAIRIYLKQQ